MRPGLRSRRRVDKNQAEIAEALIQAGCSVLRIHGVGHGAPDLIVGRKKVSYLLEVKSGKGKLTLDEETFQACWAGHYAVVRNIQEALSAVGL